MKILRPGHQYELANFEQPDKPGQLIQFIEKQPDTEKGTGILFTVKDGTTNEEVIAMLMDRLKHLDSMMRHSSNTTAIACLDRALAALNQRTAERLKRGVEGKHLP